MQFIIGIIILIAFLTLLIKFPLIIIGLGILIWGIYESSINKKLSVKNKIPLVVMIIGLMLSIGGVSYAAAGHSTSPKTSGTNATVSKQDNSPNKENSKSNSSEISNSNNNIKSDDTKNNDQASSDNETTSVVDAKPVDENKAAISKYHLIPVTVSSNVDGDTIHVTMPNGDDEPIRMLLIDTPESVDRGKPIEPYAHEASNYAKQKLPVGKKIYIKEGIVKRDKYQRLLAYVFVTPTEMYNKDVVNQGLARVGYIYNDKTFLSELNAAQSAAKSSNKAIWSIPNYVDNANDRYNIKVACNWTSSHHESTRGCTSYLPSTPKPKAEPKPKQESKPEPKTTTSAPPKKSSTPVSTKLTGTHLNVSHGSEASVTVKTKPGATGTITVIYNSGPSKAAGLEPKTASGSGIITWSWKVGTRTAPGTYQVTIQVNGTTINKQLTVS